MLVLETEVLHERCPGAETFPVRIQRNVLTFGCGRAGIKQCKQSPLRSIQHRAKGLGQANSDDRHCDNGEAGELQ